MAWGEPHLPVADPGEGLRCGSQREGVPLVEEQPGVRGVTARAAGNPRVEEVGVPERAHVELDAGEGGASQQRELTVVSS